MAPYVGDRIPLRAGEVEVGHRLVHQEAACGWLEVVDVEPVGGGQVRLQFEDCGEETYQFGDLLFRVEP